MSSNINNNNQLKTLFQIPFSPIKTKPKSIFQSPEKRLKDKNSSLNEHMSKTKPHSSGNNVSSERQSNKEETPKKADCSSDLKNEGLDQSKKKEWKSWTSEEKVIFYETIANAANCSSLQELFKKLSEVLY